MSETAYQGVWREPSLESVGLYPNLVVCDGRQSGSVTVGRSRLPVWAMVGDSSWADAIDEYGALEHYGFTEQDVKNFVFDVLNLRGEFARLLLVLADCERCDRLRGTGGAWWQRKTRVRNVRRQLQRCIDALNTQEAVA